MISGGPSAGLSVQGPPQREEEEEPKARWGQTALSARGSAVDGVLRVHNFVLKLKNRPALRLTQYIGYPSIIEPLSPSMVCGRSRAAAASAHHSVDSDAFAPLHLEGARVD